MFEHAVSLALKSRAAVIFLTLTVAAWGHFSFRDSGAGGPALTAPSAWVTSRIRARWWRNSVFTLPISRSISRSTGRPFLKCSPLFAEGKSGVAPNQNRPVSR